MIFVPKPGITKFPGSETNGMITASINQQLELQRGENMTKNSKLASGMVILIGLVALVLASSAYAKPDNAGRRGDSQRGGPMFGEILSISEDSITIAPSLPDFVKERMADRGLAVPDDLPSEATIALTTDTKWVSGGEKADTSSFEVGDMVVVATKPNDEGQLTAIKIADVESAKQAIRQDWQQRGEKRSDGGRSNNRQGDERGNYRQDGNHQRGGQGNDRQRQRPAFGEIIAMDADSITIRPEVPAFIQAKMDERGGGKEIELPDELTFNLNGKTRFIVGSEPSETNPFSVGDQVAVMGGGGQMGTAFAIADYATVEAKMSEMGGKGQRGNKGNAGQRGNQGQGGKGQKGGKRSKAPQG